MLLRARVVLPICRPPISDGAVAVSHGSIAEVGRWRDLSSGYSGPAHDCGEVVMLPGLVNAHCHLDYTDMAGHFPPPKLFTDWIKLVTTTKSMWGYSDFAESWLNGARMLLNSGTTTVGDIEAVPELLPEVWEASPLRVISFLEMTGLIGRRKADELLHETLSRMRLLPTGRSRAALSPHAPYSTAPGLLRLTAERASRSRCPVSVHLAESAEEFNMFMRRRGAMFDWLQRIGRDMSDCGMGSPVRHLALAGALRENLLAVHVNYLDRGDIALLARRRVSVAHCPRSHAYFGHRPFQFRRLRAAGVNVCLATDSLASVLRRPRERLSLDMFEEMRAFAAATRGVTPRSIVRMATIHGAKALGLEGKVGQISKGAHADLINVPFGGKLANVWDGLLGHKGDVASSMIGGQWAWQSAAN